METEQARTLLLLRHAKSAWPDVPDHDRPLGRRGRADAPAAGQWLRAAGYVPDQVLCSTARRARDTWHLAEAELGARPPVTFERGVYAASADGLLDLVRRLPAFAATVVVVGHEPGVPELASTLAARPGRRGGRSGGPSPGSDLERMHAKFPTCALAVLEFSGPWSALAPGRARLAAFVTPREMHEMRGSAHGRQPGAGE